MLDIGLNRCNLRSSLSQLYLDSVAKSIDGIRYSTHANPFPPFFGGKKLEGVGEGTGEEAREAEDTDLTAGTSALL